MIVINARFLTQTITGVQRFALEICENLPNYIEGKEVVYVCPKGNKINNFENDKKIIIVGRLRNNLWEQIELPLFLKKNGNPLLINLVGIGPIKYKNKVLTLYDLAFYHHPEWFSFTFRKTYNLLIPISVKNAKRIVTDSEYVKLDIHNTYGIKKEIIDVIYAAPSTKFVNLKLKREKIILTVSSLDPRKNLKRVINAFQEIESDYKLVIVGKSNGSFSSTIYEHNTVDSKIIFTGYLSDDDLIRLYNTASIFIYVSLFEGFGIPPLEAQASGCSCILSNTTSLPEIYGSSVRYCDPLSVSSIKKAIVDLVRNEKEREDLKRLGLKNVKKFDWKDSSKKLELIISNLSE
ncbi:Glycosyltransferase involved in cell wall bisynthesis [Maribacter sedimenticola]|uniref:Glycosyltransferase involved in cell wall bisynthesis n=1 Tax=Maribacter sedimenticola TaxID=228956 RepID=A0ABY1SCK9_9FLAO|nr:glycosyltransferase family 1 protein [Maribacter sedimenticola]SNR24584.1 Glycosyltransferase involved in cell wall bisynthesis [Maribacter sedimenticola]